MDKKETKKGFWATLFAPKYKSSCCRGSQIEELPSGTTANVNTTSCGCKSTSKNKKEITVLGTGCTSCKALYANVQEAVASLCIDASVEKEEDLDKIMSYNVMSLPALVVDGKVVAKGQNLSLEQIKKLIG